MVTPRDNVTYQTDDRAREPVLSDLTNPVFIEIIKCEASDEAPGTTLARLNSVS
jgi:hypothetical protein